MKKISIASSCYNESANIETLYDELIKQIDKYPEYEWEIVLADNCSTDNTVELLRSLAERDKRVKVILNQANYGPDNSCINAFFAATGDAVIIMASDLEDPPELIPQFIEAWESGYKVAMAQYSSRTGNPITALFRKIYYKIIASLTSVNVENNVTGFGIYDKSVVDTIRGLNEYSFVLRFLCPELGYKIKYISFVKPKRRGGRSSYSFLRYYNYAVETLVLTSHAPLHMACLVGFVMSLISILVALFYFVMKLVNWYTFDFGFAPIMIGLFFLGGVQLFFIGIIGEYLSSAIKRVTIRPFVIEKERINFDDEENK